jgi:predicted porin
MLNSNNTVTSGTSSRRAAALAAAVVAALAMVASSTALADPELDALKKQVQELQLKIDAMAKQQAAAPAAVAATPAPAPAAAPAAKPPSDGAFSMYGITLSGVLDVNLVYQSYGTPISDYFSAGTYSYIQKNSNRSIFTFGENGLSQSRITIAGEKEVMNGWSGIFRLETAINPLSGNLSDALKSLTVNNGRPCTAGPPVNCPQITGADSSVDGELFNSAAFVGFSHKDYGSFTFGRQNGLLADGIAKYDPMGASQAFSVIGISGTAGGGGDTENRRLDNSVKWNAQLGSLHAGAQYQFNGASGSAGTALQLVLGGTFPKGSVDVFYAKKEQAIASGSLSAAQVATLSCPYTATHTVAAYPGDPCVVTGGGGNALDKSLSGTISDNTAFAVMAIYNVGKAKLSAGYEHIQYANPNTPLPAGSYTLGGYVLAYVNNQVGPSSTYAINRIFQFEWLGVKYPITPSVDWTLAWYRQEQSAFATGANAGCNDARASNCSGLLNAYSTTVVYKMSKRLDAYGGAMWSGVRGGLANGFIVRSTIDPTLGVRYTF